MDNIVIIGGNLTKIEFIEVLARKISRNENKAFSKKHYQKAKSLADKGMFKTYAEKLKTNKKKTAKK